MKIIRKHRDEAEEFIRQYSLDPEKNFIDEDALHNQAVESLTQACTVEAMEKKAVMDAQKQAWFETAAQNAYTIACTQNLNFVSNIKGTRGSIQFFGNCLFFDKDITLPHHRVWFDELVENADNIWIFPIKCGDIQLQLDYDLGKDE